ncbi:oxygenase MpaB family protein [Nocardia sp. NPDC005366]|uniref:oxygenase MpaB family protein n=1 Tax=Nocardia sp. NPDC005366 TaxID=3156878 RepID=UPI0033B32209
MDSQTPHSVSDTDYTEIPVAERALVHLTAQRQVWPIFLFRAMALQGSHPTIAVALEDHSTGFTEPAARASRTLSYAYRVYFGENLAETAREIRQLHRPITGQGYDGKPYHAWNREAWTWVHLTTVEAMLYAVGACFPSLSAEDAEAFYREGRAIGLLYGVREQDMPADIAGLRAYVDAGIQDKLATSPGTRRLRRLVDEQSILELPLPRPIQVVVDRLAARPVHTLMFGGFPEPIRRLWDVRWTRAREIEYRALLTALRVGSRALPRRLLLVPEARAALHD